MMDEGFEYDESQIKDQIRPFTISIDYDDTFSSCIETWTSVINVLRRAGAKVVCITSRKPEDRITNFPGEVFYCSGRPKAEVALENELEVKVWIDDQPEYIGVNPERAAMKKAFGIR